MAENNNNARGDLLRAGIFAGIFAFLAERGPDILGNIFKKGAEKGLDHVMQETFGGINSPVDEKNNAMILQGMRKWHRRVWDGIEYRIQENYGKGPLSQRSNRRNADRRRVEWSAQAVGFGDRILGSLEREYLVEMLVNERRAQINAGKSREEALLIAQAKVEAYLYMNGFPMPKGTDFLRFLDNMIPVSKSWFMATTDKILGRHGLQDRSWFEVIYQGRFKEHHERLRADIAQKKAEGYGEAFDPIDAIINPLKRAGSFLKREWQKRAPLARRRLQKAWQKFRDKRAAEKAKKKARAAAKKERRAQNNNRERFKERIQRLISRKRGQASR